MAVRSALGLFAVAGAIAAPGAAAGTDVADSPNLTACLSVQLHLEIVAFNAYVRYGKPHPRTVYLTNIDAYVTNSSPLPCYLTGDASAILVRGGQALALRYHRSTSEITTDNAVDAANALAFSVLAPGQTDVTVLAWTGPYCGSRAPVAVQIPFLDGPLTSRSTIPAPPCRGSGRTEVDSDPWRPVPLPG